MQEVVDAGGGGGVHVGCGGDVWLRADLPVGIRRAVRNEADERRGAGVRGGGEYGGVSGGVGSDLDMQAGDGGQAGWAVRAVLSISPAGAED